MRKEKLAEILAFFEPISLNDFNDKTLFSNAFNLGASIIMNLDTKPIEVKTKFEIAIIAVPEYRNSTISYGINGLKSIREEIYKLNRISPNLKIADFGTIRLGNTVNDTYFAISEVCSMLMNQKITVFLIGGSQDLTIGCFRAFNGIENNVNLTCVDAAIDWGGDDGIINESSYIKRIVDEGASSLYNVTCMGYQSCYVDFKQINILNEHQFDHIRLGKLRDEVEEVEVIMRDSDLVSFDISAVKISEAPGQLHANPNGLYAEEACQIARYAGLSDRLRMFGVFGFYPEYDQRNQTSKLISQLFWYFLEGYYNRKHDFPDISLEEYTKYLVEIDEIEFPIVFYKSSKTNRWWLEVSSSSVNTSNVQNSIVSCSENDYKKACQNEIPNRWWSNFKKIN